MKLPRHYELFNPVLQAIRELSGSASIAELDETVTKNLNLPEDVVVQPHGSGRITELQYRLAWARSYLKAYGLLDNSKRGVWHLTAQGADTSAVDPKLVKRYVQGLHAAKGKANSQEPVAEVPEAEPEDDWREILLRRLLEMPADAFERLSQRILRESGFTRVTVTGQSNDGGIDGTGIVQLGNLLSFPILFQCKRYKGSVGAGAIRDFRGAMVGRTDRGLIITTGSFSREAKVEATRDGAPLIDLVDGEQLLERLKELRLGVDITARMVEDVRVITEFFDDM